VSIHGQRQVREAEQALTAALGWARRRHRSWADIGDAFGVTRQAAQQGFADMAAGRG